MWWGRGIGDVSAGDIGARRCLGRVFCGLMHRCEATLSASGPRRKHPRFPFRTRHTMNLGNILCEMDTNFD